MRLSDLGEFAVLDQIVLPRASRLGALVGGDCARVPVGTIGDLIISSDKGNVPLVWSLPEYATRYADMGWLTAIAGISDLATSGATPICATNNIVAPRDFLVEDLESFVSGFCEALECYGFQHAGGDLSEGTAFSVSSTFVGASDQFLTKSRKPTSGKVVVIGELGTFAAAFCKARELGFSSLSAEEVRLLTKPEVPYKLMSQILEAGVVEEATDASDGIHTAVRILSQRTRSKVVIDLGSIEYSEQVSKSSELVDVPPEQLGFAWGNWQPVLFVPNEEWSPFCAFVSNKHIQLLGTYESGPPSVLYCRDRRKVAFEAMNNEAFGGHSYIKNAKLPFL